MRRWPASLYLAHPADSRRRQGEGQGADAEQALLLRVRRGVRGFVSRS